MGIRDREIESKVSDPGGGPGLAEKTESKAEFHQHAPSATVDPSPLGVVGRERRASSLAWEDFLGGEIPTPSLQGWVHGEVLVESLQSFSQKSVLLTMLANEILSKCSDFKVIRSHRSEGIGSYRLTGQSFCLIASSLLPSDVCGWISVAKYYPRNWKRKQALKLASQCTWAREAYTKETRL